MFNLGYEVLLQALNRFFTHTDETDEQLDTLVGAAFGLMAGVLRPLGRTLPRLPAGPAIPGGRPGRRSRCTTSSATSCPGASRLGAAVRARDHPRDAERRRGGPSRRARRGERRGYRGRRHSGATLAHVPEELRHAQ